MSLTVKKAATVLSLATIATAFVVACAAAQVGPGNPSGGTIVRATQVEGGSVGPVGLASRQLTLPVVWQGAFGTFLASQYANSFIAHTTVARRTQVKR